MKQALIAFICLLFSGNMYTRNSQIQGVWVLDSVQIKDFMSLGAFQEYELSLMSENQLILTDEYSGTYQSVLVEGVAKLY